jgi:hypothetical protein
LGYSSGLVIHEKYPSLGLVGVRDRRLGEDAEGVLDPVDHDYVVGRWLLDFLGHGKQTRVVQNIPPWAACIL